VIGAGMEEEVNRDEEKIMRVEEDWEQG